MKLRNKKTGEIVDVESIGLAEFLDGKFGNQVTLWWKEDGSLDTCRTYNSLAELNAEWEDYEEPKEYWFIDRAYEARATNSSFRNIVADQEIGNYFKTEEEAKKAVEKLKIYNKLKQKGFVFSGWYYSTEGQLVILADNHEFSETEPEDLTKLFGDKIC